MAFAPLTQEINRDKLGLVSLTVSPTVPEPSSSALMLVRRFRGLGLAGFHRTRTNTGAPRRFDRVRTLDRSAARSPNRRAFRRKAAGADADPPAFAARRRASPDGRRRDSAGRGRSPPRRGRR